MRRSVLLLCCLALAGACAPSARAATSGNQFVVGSVASLLSLDVTSGLALGSPVALTLTPGQTASGTGTLLVTTTGAYTLSVQDQAATTPGFLDRTDVAGTCPGGVSSLASALSVKAEPTLIVGGATSQGFKSVDGTVKSLATGSLTNNFLTTYNQAVGATEAINSSPLCSYNLTATYSVIAG